MTDERISELPRYLQLLWDQEPEGRRGPKPGRSIEEIGSAAAAIADREGLEAVSMKSVAAAVGFTTMSLYRYVDSKDELEAVMLDVAYGPPPTPLLRSDEGWRGRIAAWAREISERRLAHPWTVDIHQSAPPLTPNLIEWMEAGLAALEDTPIAAKQRLSAMLAIDGWALNHVRQSLQMGLLGPPEPGSRQDAYFGHISRLIDPARFPRLTAAGPEEIEDDADDFFEEEFERGLGLLLDGLAALIARSR